MNRITSKKSNQNGFTLIEVMVAMVVLVIGVLGVLYMQLATVKGNANAIGISKAVQEASATLDKMESLDFDSAGLDDDGTTTGKNLSLLFGDENIAITVDGTITYVVDDLKAADLVTELGYAKDPDPFQGVRGKLITVTSSQNVSGHPRNIEIQLIKIDL